MAATSSYVRDLHALARRYGCDAVATRSNHWKLIDRRGRGFVFCAGSPSCQRALRNTEARLRRMGRDASETYRRAA